MDSFYDGPRQPPVPTALNKVDAIPAVPEVSVFENSFRPDLSRNNVRNLNKLSSHESHRGHNFYNTPNEANCMDNSRKHVRFQNPKPFTILEKNINKPELICKEVKENVPHNFQRIGPNLHGDTFKQIYMANVPNRHLDLSILETPCTEVARISPNRSKSPRVQENIAIESPKNFAETYKDFKRITQSENQDFLVKNSHFQHDSYLKEIQRTNFRDFDHQYRSPFSATQREAGVAIAPTTCCNIVSDKPSTELAPASSVADEPTIKDLFQIIKQQNEQIMLLQHQVSNLKTTIQPNQPQIDTNPHFGKIQDDTRTPFLMNSPSKKGISKFSIDLKATSFEVSFRPQTSAPHKFRKQNEYFEPKIQEIVESDGNTPQQDNYKDLNDLSLNLNDSLTVKNSYVSAVPSIQINMDQYESSEEDEEQESSLNLGTTFYKDLMDQVNNALRSMKIQTDCQNRRKSTNEIKGQTINAVKQATLQHLKSIGVNLPPIQETNEITTESDSEQSEISFAVKQLLMKYLPDDKLAQAMKKNEKPEQIRQFVKNDVKKQPGAEFSFATMQYLKKYNIIDAAEKPLPVKAGPKNNNPKILDVTALKLQPKLL